MKQLNDAFQYRRFGLPPRSTLALLGRFDHVPHNSVTALLRKAGPFKADRDAYGFTNKGWPITEEDARVLRERYQGLVDKISLIGVDAIRTALSRLSFSIPIAGPVGLPAAAISYVINEVTGDLRNQLIDTLVISTTSSYGRCGGMAFSALDFFLIGWSVESSDVQPASGELRQYIWHRLLDSLEKNAPTFFEWIMVLHILPVISRLASGALGAAAGSVIGGPLGAVVGAFVAGSGDVLGVGGPDDLLSKTREHWTRLRTRLDHEAAWPIGFIYAGNASPIDQHQILAIGYDDQGDGTARLIIWDNNDGRRQQSLNLDFRGDQLFINSFNPKLNDVKGIICEDYAFKMPPTSLHR